MKNIFCRVLLFTELSLLALTPGAAFGKNHHPSDYPSLANTTVLVIRHAEKPAHGDGLSPAGTAHALAYVSYFEHFQIDGAAPIKLTALFAAADSSSSHRPYLTLQPLSQALGLPIDDLYKDHDYMKLVDALQSTSHGRFILICWHQGDIPNLVRALGAEPDELLPDGNWPEDQYGWVIQLRFDAQGQLESAERIVENF